MALTWHLEDADRHRTPPVGDNLRDKLGDITDLTGWEKRQGGLRVANHVLRTTGYDVELATELVAMLGVGEAS